MKYRVLMSLILVFLAASAQAGFSRQLKVDRTSETSWQGIVSSSGGQMYYHLIPVNKEARDGLSMLPYGQMIASPAWTCILELSATEDGPTLPHEGIAFRTAYLIGANCSPPNQK